MPTDRKKVESFVVRAVSSYKKRRDQFIGSHVNRAAWFLRRIRPSTKHREAEYQRVLSEHLSFYFKERGQFKFNGIANLASIDKETLRKAIFILNTHIAVLKYRSDYLTLGLGLFGLLLTGGMLLWRVDPKFWPGNLAPLFIAGVVAIIERHFFIEKIYMYEATSPHLE